MSCKEILPQINIDGIFIKESDGKVADATISFSPQADELFTTTISHTNLVQIDSFGEGFSIFDLLEATAGSPDLYGVKFLVTNSPEKAKLIEDIINVSQEVSFYQYGAIGAVDGTAAAASEASETSDAASQNATAQDVKNFIKNTPSNAPAGAKSAINELNKCIADIAQKGAKGGSSATGTSTTTTTTGTGGTGGAASRTAPLSGFGGNLFALPSVQTLADRIIDSVNDNSANNLNPTRDKIFSFSRTIEVDQEEISLKGKNLTPTFVNSQEASFMYADTQLKNLYLFMIPNVEYRENKKLIFTVRDYQSIPLVINFQPQLFGGTEVTKPMEPLASPVTSDSSFVGGLIQIPQEQTPIDISATYTPGTPLGPLTTTTLINQKKVAVQLLKDNLQVDPTKLIFSTVNMFIKNIFDTKAYKDTWTQNLVPAPFITDPLVSLGYGGDVNGVFYLNQKALAKNLTSYEGLLEQPKLYKNVLKKVSIKKVYTDGTEVALKDPEPYDGLSFAEGVIIGYRFRDTYDLKDFSYVVSVDAKNPLEFLLKYVMPKLTYSKMALDKLLTNITATSRGATLVILNPVSGFFTDDFLASSAYDPMNLVYGDLVTMLSSLYNFLIPGDPVGIKETKLVNTQQLYDLQTFYDSMIKTMQTLAAAEKINIQTEFSFSSKKKSRGNYEPYKTLIQKYDKPYMSSDGPVFFDFLYREEPSNRSGFEVNPVDMAKRINLEGELLNFFGVADSDNTYVTDEPISITPLSIKIDQTSVDLVDDLEKLEEVATNVLLAAELEVKDPNQTFTSDSDTIAKLLGTDGTQVVNVSSKTLKAKKEKDNFIPTEIANNKPVIKAKKYNVWATALKAMFDELNKRAKEELGDQTAKALYLDEADTSPWTIVGATLLKTGFQNYPTVDKKHGDIAKILGVPSYKVMPSTFMTRLMNSYQLEYISSFNMETNQPVYFPLTHDVIEGTTGDMIRVVRMIMKAGVPLTKEYTPLHSYFLLSKNVTPLFIIPVFDFLPDLPSLPSLGILDPLEVKLKASMGLAPSSAPTSTTSFGAVGTAGIDDSLGGGY